MALFTPRMPAIATPDLQSGGTADLCAAQCYQTTISFETGELTINRVDVVFLIDVTGSMRDERDQIVNNSVEIMNTLRDLVPDSAFGVASFADYNEFYDDVYNSGGPYGSGDDYPYRLDRDITEDTNAVRNALNGVIVLYGNDTPESNSRAVWEMQFLNWRENSKRIVIIFGDAYPHDNTGFFSSNWGVDPGRDEIGGTSDDLVFTDVVEQVADAGISFLAVNSGTDSDSVLFSSYLAEETGGQYFELSYAGDIPYVIADLVTTELSMVDQVTLRASGEYADWFTFSPEVYYEVGSHESGSFDVEICPIDGRARPGTYTIEFVVDADGTVLDTIPVTINYAGRCEGGVDLFVPDHPSDDGTVCSNVNGEPFWEGDRIVVRNEDDDFYYHQNPIYGQPNYIYTEIQNLGDMDVTGATVTLYWANPALGLFYPESWNRIGSMTIDVAAGGSTWTEPLEWSPPGSGHYCLLARVEHPDDPITREGDVPCDNNIAQRNLNILDLDTEDGTTIGEDEVVFIIVGPPDAEGGVVDIVIEKPEVPPDTEIRLIMPSDLFERWLEAGGVVDGGYVDGTEIVVDPAARETIIRDVPLEPGEQREVSLRVKAPNADPFSLTVKERVNGEDIGGNVYYYVPPDQRPQPPSRGIAGLFEDFSFEDIPVWAIVACICVALLAVVVVIAVVVVVLVRRKKK
jgi:hypothetical protein